MKMKLEKRKPLAIENSVTNTAYLSLLSLHSVGFMLITHMYLTVLGFRFIYGRLFQVSFRNTKKNSNNFVKLERF